ncbi:hypothetical protein CS060_13145 [Anoxybacillus flavithermus]|uniref:Uncharacterized protein n=1 Tax=Anoxybacillus flavithermus TaxID=33934 RepID=A0A2G5RMC0_9BACL|nr:MULTISPECIES: hypothetical protein [Anoxybacillus]KFZ43677.1 hypothetical protein JS80_01860 [Anoxybacillus sp. KU2-6(11)]PIC03822.1 hypothetical protein CS060_13145 [Anoxybacillus flavithermus]
MEHGIGYDGTRRKRSHHHLKRTREDDWNTLEFGDDEEYELEYDEEEVEWDEGEEATEHESFTQASSKSTTNDQAFVLIAFLSPVEPALCFFYCPSRIFFDFVEKVCDISESEVHIW